MSINLTADPRRTAPDREAGQPRASGDGPSFKIQALAPLALGFSAPILVLVFIDHPLIQEARHIFILMLFALFAVLGALFLFAMFAPRTLSGLALDPSGQSLVLTYSNLLSDSDEHMPIVRVRRILQVAAYDQDGYARGAGEIVLRTGERIALPFAPPADCVAAFDA
ncbi:MAG: hypothetical protein AAFR55_02725 [Pseudomonadota bacterium]